MKHFTICYNCRYAKRIDVNKIVDCEILGEVSASLFCKHFKPSGSEQQKLNAENK
jgi:hypothetical protein